MPPKSKAQKISLIEPADRPLSISLSIAELIVLRDHHKRMIRRITRDLGMVLADCSGNMPKREEKQLVERCRSHQNAHKIRVIGLNSIINQHVENTSK